jgi:hypothetical protein
MIFQSQNKLEENHPCQSFQSRTLNNSIVHCEDGCTLNHLLGILEN